MESDKPKTIGHVNLERGYLPLFAKSFIEKYGLFSLFVRAVSDYFTIATVRLLQAHDTPVPHNIAKYAPDEATETLSMLMKSLFMVHGRSVAALALLHECTGLKPIGSFSDLVNSTIGVEIFQKWLTALEAENYEEACSVVKVDDSDERT